MRELIQNALDATKMQLYRTLSAYGFQFNEKTSPFDVERAYPNIFEEHAIMIHTDYSRETGKVYFSIRDKGIGISMDEFKRKYSDNRTKLAGTKKNTRMKSKECRNG